MIKDVVNNFIKLLYVIYVLLRNKFAIKFELKQTISKIRINISLNLFFFKRPLLNLFINLIELLANRIL